MRQATSSRSTDRHRLIRAALIPAALAVCAVLACSMLAHAETLQVHGSTTFTRALLEPFQRTIEVQSGHRLAVIPNNSGKGLVDLLEGRADLAMLSAGLDIEIETVRKARPDFDYTRLQAHPISETRVALAVHPTNDVRSITRDQLARILTGTIRNWSELGGRSQAIRPVYVRTSGGVASVVIASVMPGKEIEAPDAIPVETATQIVKIVAQEPGALGLAQLHLVKQYKLGELAAGPPMTQQLLFVTKGPPSPAAMAVIKATREVADKRLAKAQ